MNLRVANAVSDGIENTLRTMLDERGVDIAGSDAREIIKTVGNVVFYAALTLTVPSTGENQND